MIVLITVIALVAPEAMAFGKQACGLRINAHEVSGQIQVTGLCSHFRTNKRCFLAACAIEAYSICGFKIGVSCQL